MAAETTTQETYDLIVIGAGPAGYVAAIRAAQLGMRVACAEGRSTLGGTCLNIGCIPSKALLYASQQFTEAQTHFATLGIALKETTLDWAQMQKHKNSVVAANTKGIEFLFKKNRIDWLQGWAKITAPNRIAIDNKTYAARFIVIASGSETAPLVGVKVDEKRIVTSTGALALATIPKELIVIGGGVIGVELGSVYARLGSKVHILEYADTILVGWDHDIPRAFKRILQKQGITCSTGVAVNSATSVGKSVQVRYTLRNDNTEHTLKSNVVLLATGRQSFTAGLGLDDLGVACNAQGHITVNANYETSVSGIYAIGDAIPGAMLAHKAEDEGIAVAEILAGQSGHVNYNVIPNVVYTHPEIASIGATEQALVEQGHAYKVGQFSFLANGRAKANLATDGFVKILADKSSDRILGAHIIGPNAGDLIHEIAIAMEFGAAAEDIARTCHAHPTYSEAIREAALACGDGAVHA